MRDNRNVKDAVYLIDDRTLKNRKTNVQSGWDFDDRGLPEDVVQDRPALILASNGGGKYRTVLKREIVPVREGKAGFDFEFTIVSGDGFFAEFCSEDDKTALIIEQKDGMFYCGKNMLSVPADKKTHFLGIDFNMDTRLAEITFGGEFVGTYPIECGCIKRIKIGYDGTKQGRAEVNRMHMYINYLLNDKCPILTDGNLPYGWKTYSNGAARVYRSRYYEGNDLTTYVITSTKGSSARAVHDFAKSDGKVAFCIRYLTKSAGQDVKISLLSSGERVITVCDDGEKSMTLSGKTVRQHSVYVWQYLRIEADVKTGKAFIKHNGKKCGEFDFDKKTEYLDGVEISYETADGGVLKFTDISAWNILPEPDDYVSAPVIPEKKDYYVGMNICSLWRNGEHWGWDVISPMEENKTYMGYYDEGLPEVADWEIKWMKEHGLDFEMYCWYASQTTAPICTTRFSAAIHEGHFNAKYGDDMKFCLIWEAANGPHPANVGFREYVVPYWVDYFFTDPRYMTIENKLVIASFEFPIKDYGSPEAIKADMEYLDETAKKLGFDGIILMACCTGGSFDRYAVAGVDALYAYTWGKWGYDGEYTKKRITDIQNKGNIHFVPTVSTGFNSVAWAGTRSPQMTPETMGDVLKWFKEENLPSRQGEDWKRKLVVFSTWNEYGEGTYICPSGLCGFGYLDEMRKAFTDAKEPHTDVRPDEHQLDRLGYLYPKGRSLLRAQMYGDANKFNFVESVKELNNEIAMSEIETQNGVELKIENGRLCGIGPNFDPQIYLHTEINADVVKAVRTDMVTCGPDETLPEKNAYGTYKEWRLLFVTEQEPVWTWSQSVGAYVNKDGTLTFDFSANPHWHGKITDIRFDPTEYAGKFAVTKLEFLSDRDTVHTFIDGKVYDSTYPAVIEDGEAYMPFEPQKDFCRLMKLYHEWYRGEKTLMVMVGDKKVLFTVGSDKVIVGKETLQLKKPLETYDSLPMIPMSVFDKLGHCKTAISEKTVNIELC